MDFKEILLPPKSFVRSALSLALPLILQNFIVYALNMMDIILLQGLGDTAVASVSIANQANLVLNLLIFGTASASSIFLAQCRGSGNYAAMRKTVWITIIIISAATVSFGCVTTFAPEWVMSLMTDRKNLVTAGASYLRIVPLSYVMGGISMMFSTLLRCNEKTKLPLFASTIALTLDTTLNYILIYGKFGLPVLGIHGAAISTVISRAVELLLILSFVYLGREKRIKPTLLDFTALRVPFIRNFFKISLPVISNELIWGLGVTTYSAIYGRMGEVTVAAMSVASIMDQTFSVIATGCGHITTIVIGQLLGRGEFETAKLRAKTLSVWSLLLGVLTTGVMALTGPFFVKGIFTNLTHETTSLSVRLIFMFACFMPIRAFNFTNIVGTLRSGGDSLVAALLDIGPMYLYSIPIGILLGLHFKLPSILVICFMYGEELIKATTGCMRMLKYRWVRKI